MAHFRGYFNLEEKDAKMASFCYYTSFVRRKEICDVKPKLAFSALLPTVTSSENAGEGAHSGKKFMTNLLVSSLMEESELKSALLTAIKVEVSKICTVFSGLATTYGVECQPPLHFFRIKFSAKVENEFLIGFLGLVVYSESL